VIYKNDVIKALWDKVWSGSVDVENLCVDKMKPLGIMRGFGRYCVEREDQKIFQSVYNWYY